MARIDNIRDEETAAPWLQRTLVALMLAALAAGLLIGFILYQGGRKPAILEGKYGAAMQAGLYEDAIGLYRKAQEQALIKDHLGRSQARYQSAVAHMEQQAGEKLQAIENALLNQEQLDTQTLSFAESMAEVSAVRLNAFLRGLCAGYLVGDVEKPVLEGAFAQLAALANLRDVAAALQAQIGKMTEAQGPVMAAMAKAAASDFWGAYDGISDVLARGQWAGFVQEQAFKLQEKIKADMHGPLLETAASLVEGGRYLSALQALEKLDKVFPGDSQIESSIAACKAVVPPELTVYQGAIEIIAVKPLIVDPARAFDGDAYALTAAESMITTGEFSKMLEELYQNGFILIDSTVMVDANRRLATLRLPPGKKPLVLVIEGLNYYATRRETGNSWDLILDQDGEVCAVYPDQTGNLKTDRHGEAIGILDDFVKEHPDFSLDGAKGTISLTGYECVFGKITDRDQVDDRNKALQDNGMAAIVLTDDEIAANRDEARAIIDRLKKTGWVFASSTYGFIDARNQPLERIQSDTRKWFDQVGSLTGPVSMLNYPNGAYISGSDPRAEWLKKQGFVLFGGLGTRNYLFVGKDYIYVDKTPVNGFTMRNSKSYQLERLFDASRVYDRRARPG
jgi:hypothetical protein